MPTQVNAIPCIYTGEYLYKRIRNKMTYFLSKWDRMIWLLSSFQMLSYLALCIIVLCILIMISEREEWKRVGSNIFCFRPTDCGHEAQPRVVAVTISAITLCIYQSPEFSSGWVQHFLYFTQFMLILLTLLHRGFLTLTFVVELCICIPGEQNINYNSLKKLDR